MLVNLLPKWEGLEPVAFVGDDGHSPSFLKEVAQRPDVVCLVRQELSRRWQLADERFSHNAIADIPACQQESYRPAFAIRKRVDFARAAAPADAERLVPFFPCAARWALMAVESMLFS